MHRRPWSDALFLACIIQPACAEDIQCFFACTGSGGGGAFCFDMCVDNPAALQVITCVLGNCGGACF